MPSGRAREGDTGDAEPDGNADVLASWDGVRDGVFDLGRKGRAGNHADTLLRGRSSAAES